MDVLVSAIIGLGLAWIVIESTAKNIDDDDDFGGGMMIPATNPI